MTGTKPGQFDLSALARERIEKGSKSFAAASRLFAPQMRDDARKLYAWCRYCDDAIDGQDLGHGRIRGDGERQAMLDEVARITQRTEEALDGHPHGPEFVALAEVAARHGIPRQLPLELIDGFRMDAEGRVYRTIEDTLDYSYHVAGVVGVMMARIMGARDAATLERAQDLGLAFQLTNICRDVAEDFAAGRIYLPAEWLEEAGVEAGRLMAPENREGLFGVVRRMLQLADRYYASAREGLPALPLRAAWAVGAASAVYRGIGRIVVARGPAALDERASVGAFGKANAVTTGLGAALASRVPLQVRGSRPRDPALWTKIGRSR